MKAQVNDIQTYFGTFSISNPQAHTARAETQEDTQ
jgi:hypothetical protein